MKIVINPLTSPWEEVSEFTYLYLSAGAPALGEAKWLMYQKYYNELYNLIKEQKLIKILLKMGLN